MDTTETKRKERVPIWVLAVYSVLLYGVWTVQQFLILPRIEKIPNGVISALLHDGLCKNLIWTLPALLLIHKYSDKLEVPMKEMLDWKKEYLPYLAVFPGFVGYVLMGIFANKMPLKFELAPKDIVTVLFVGVTEELVFRAWLLNAAMPRAKKPKSLDETPYQQYAVIAVNAAMFLAIHFPRWIKEGIFVTNFTSFGFVSIILLSVIFSLVFLKTKNIVLPIALHMFWDLLIFAMY